VTQNPIQQALASSTAEESLRLAMFPSPSSAFRPARLERRDSSKELRLATRKLPRKSEDEARGSLRLEDGRTAEGKKPGLY